MSQPVAVKQESDMTELQNGPPCDSFGGRFGLRHTGVHIGEPLF
jgi:hypothetical protein